MQGEDQVSVVGGVIPLELSYRKQVFLPCYLGKENIDIDYDLGDFFMIRGFILLLGF